MKKFFTVITLQVEEPLSRYLYQAVGNQKLQVDKPISFPILTAIQGYVEPGEKIRVIALVSEGAIADKNLKEFGEQLESICQEKKIQCVDGVETITLPKGQAVADYVGIFQELINYTEDEDELFACMTYGTKPASTSLLTAIHYAYRIKRNCSISCIVYGEIQRNGRNKEEWKGYVYDMTALIQLDEIISTLAKMKIEQPERIVKTILDL